MESDGKSVKPTFWTNIERIKREYGEFIMVLIFIAYWTIFFFIEDDRISKLATGIIGIGMLILYWFIKAYHEDRETTNNLLRHYGSALEYHSKKLERLEVALKDANIEIPKFPN